MVKWDQIEPTLLGFGSTPPNFLWLPFAASTSTWFDVACLTINSLFKILDGFLRRAYHYFDIH